MEPVVEITRPLIDRESQANIGGFIVLYLFIGLIFVAIGPTVFSSTWVSSSDFHACIEISSSFIAIIAALACLMYYYGFKSRYFLIIGLGFFICGSQALVHGIFGFGRLFEGSGVDFSRFIPGTYVAGRCMLAITIIAAALLETRLKTTESVRKEAIIFSSTAFILGGGATLLALTLPLPRFIYPEDIISRPVDFISAILYAIAFFLIIKRFLITRDIFSGMLLACILLNIGGQVYMSFSKQLFDIFFDVAHWSNILSYCMPVVGITVQSLQEMRRSNTVTLELAQLIDTANAPIFGVDTKGNINEWNQKVAEITGYAKEEVLGQNLVGSYITEEYRDSVRSVLDDALGGKEAANYEVPLYTSGGSRVMVLLSATSRRDVDGNIVGVIGVGQDITELDAQRTEMESVTLELTQLIDTANAPIFGVDTKGNINEWNQKVAEITGYAKEEVLGQNLVGSYITEEYRDSVRSVLDDALGGKEAANYEVPLYTSGGSRVMVLLSATSRRDVDGNIVGVIGVGQDITELDAQRTEMEREIGERKAAEEALREQTHELGERVKELKCLYGISHLIEQADISLEEVLQGTVDLIPPSWQYPEITCARIILEDKEFKTRNFREAVWKQSGEIVVDAERLGYLEVCYLEEKPESDEGPFLKEERLLINVIAERLGTIVEQKRVEEELLEAKEAAERASKAKSEFLANMSHEIRTPMNSILGFTQILLGEELSAEHRDALETIKGSGERLMSLIDEILDLSKIEAESIVLEEVPFTMDSLVLGAMKMVRFRAEKKPVEIRYDPQDGSQWVVGDPMRVRQVLLNLLTNAVKFTEQGEILTTIRSVEETEDRVSVEVAVSDTGIGIPKDKLDAIFEVFTQADGSTTRKYGGTGLGLTISQRLVRQMGGEIRVESQVGKGSTFRFNLWLKKGPAEPDLDKRPAVPEGLAKEKGIERGLKILLAEDDPANQKMTMLMLQKMGHSVELAEDGVEAVEMAQAQAYDIILMDMQMPNMGGLEATQKLRQAGVKTPIVAMTSSAMKGDRERFLEAGADDYIGKPIKRDMVRDTLNRYAGVKREPEIPDPDQVTLPPVETIAEELGLDQEQYWEILMEFIEDKKKDMEDLGSALVQGDTDLVSRLAHKIKGSALNLRLDSLGKPAANIEKAANEGDLSGIGGDWDALNLEFEALDGRRKRNGASA